MELAKEVPKAQWGDEDVEEVKTNCKVVEKPRTVSLSVYEMIRNFSCLIKKAISIVNRRRYM